MPSSTLKRALPVGVLAALAVAPSALAVPKEPCSTCEPPGDPTDLSVAPDAGISGPGHAYRITDVQFDATATTAGRDADGDPATITKVEWDLDGDGAWDNASGTALRRSIIYPQGGAVGVRTVKVRVTSTGGTDTAQTTIDIRNHAPAIGLDVSDATPGVGTTVTFTSTIGDADSANRYVDGWDFGRGTFCTIFDSGACVQPTQTMVFDQPGEYTWRARVRDTDGATGVASRTVKVHPAPTAALSAPAMPVVAGDEIVLDAGGSTGEGDLTYLWDADGNDANGFERDTGSSAQLRQAYSSSRTVRVQVVDDDGMVATAEAAVAVHGAPQPRFSIGPAAPRTGQAVTFDATASTDDGAITKVEWDLDGNGTYEVDNGTNRRVQWIYETAGTRTVRLRVTDDHGVQRVKTAQFTGRAPQAAPAPKPPVAQPAPAAAAPPASLPAPVAAATSRAASPAAKTAAKKKRAKRTCRTVKAKRKGRTIKKRVCRTAKKKAAKRRTAKRRAR